MHCLTRLAVLFLAFTTTCATAETAEEAHNKAIAIALYQAKSWEEARQYIGPEWIEHHPKMPKSMSGEQFIEQYYKNLKVLLPQQQSVVLRAFAQGDLVALHVRDIDEPGMKGTAIIAFYRFENGKVVEHWHAYQPVAGVMNPNGMF